MSLVQTTQPQTQTSVPSQPAQKTTFPDKLKQYVARTFEDCPPESKPEVEVELKRIITDAFNEKVVWSLEWDKMPLPQEILATKRIADKKEKEENKAKMVSMQVNNGLRSPPSKLDTSEPFSSQNRVSKYSSVMNNDHGGKKRKR